MNMIVTPIIHAMINHDATKVLPVKAEYSMLPTSQLKRSLCLISIVNGNIATNQNRYSRALRFKKWLHTPVFWRMESLEYIFLKKKYADMMKNTGTAILTTGMNTLGSNFV